MARKRKKPAGIVSRTYQLRVYPTTYQRIWLSAMQRELHAMHVALLDYAKFQILRSLPVASVRYTKTCKRCHAIAVVTKSYLVQEKWYCEACRPLIAAKQTEDDRQQQQTERKSKYVKFSKIKITDTEAWGGYRYVQEQPIPPLQRPPADPVIRILHAPNEVDPLSEFSLISQTDDYASALRTEHYALLRAQKWGFWSRRSSDAALIEFRQGVKPERYHPLLHSPVLSMPTSIRRTIARRVSQSLQAYRKQPFSDFPTPPRRPKDVSLHFDIAHVENQPVSPESLQTRPVAVNPSHALASWERSTRFLWWQLPMAKNDTSDIAGYELGDLKTRAVPTIPDDADVRTITLIQKADGWYMSVTCEVPAPDQPPRRTNTIGVDLNVKHEGLTQETVAVSDPSTEYERVFRQPAALKKEAKRLAHLQKMVNPKRTVRGSAKAADPKSNRSYRRRQQIAKIHQRITRQVTHVQHYITKRITDKAGVIAVENINWANLRRKGKGRRKRGLNRAMSTAAPGRIVQMLKMKAHSKGRGFVKVDPRGTSQTCAACGETSPVKLQLHVREWVCPHCGTIHHRDLNAARNIALRGIDEWNQQPPTAFSGRLDGEHPETTTESSEEAVTGSKDRASRGKNRQATNRLQRQRRAALLRTAAKDPILIYREPLEQGSLFAGLEGFQ